MENREPKIVCFSCKFSWGYLGDEETLAAQIKNWIPIICSGKLDAKHIIMAFNHGADGVLILGCPEGNCHYQDGNFEVRKRIALLRKTIEPCGIEPERISLVLSKDPKGTTIPELVEKFSNFLKYFGPIKVTI